jgi:hypothetical protein
MKYKAAVGYSMLASQMLVDQTQMFDTKAEAEDWAEFMFNMNSEYDMVEINPINK